jgi:hypothetical protein
MMHVSASISLSGRPLLSSRAPSLARFQVAMAPGTQHQPLMSYLRAEHTTHGFVI